MALGARPADVLRLAIEEGMRLVACGLALGVAAALATTRFMASLLYGVGAADPSTIVLVSLLLLLVSLAASYVPARRASRVDPAASLRYE